MDPKEQLEILEALPDIVARLRAAKIAADALAEINYAGAGSLALELGEVISELDLGACQVLGGVRLAAGDPVAFEAWESGLAARIRAGETL